MSNPSKKPGFHGDPPAVEYLVVTDRDSKIVLSTLDYYEAVKLANVCRRTGGEVTIFKSTKA